MKTQLLPYHKKYDEEIRRLECSVVQGTGVQLEIIKEHFLDRAVVFKNHITCLVLDSMDKLMGVSIGAQIPLKVNGELFDAGIGIDLKVDPAHRNKGIGRMMTEYILKNFFTPQGLKRNFMTLKKSNIPVVKMASRTIRSMWFYEFIYLTIPTTARTPGTPNPGVGQQLFKVSLFSNDPVSPSYYVNLTNGLSYFNTHLTYQLKIRHMNFFIRYGLRILQKLTPRKYPYIPHTGDIIRFATLYNHTVENIGHINEALVQLDDQGINFLMVCCCKDDPIYTSLKPLAIHTQDYLILSDFPLHPNDELTIDVRCL